MVIAFWENKCLLVFFYKIIIDLNNFIKYTDVVGTDPKKVHLKISSSSFAAQVLGWKLILVTRSASWPNMKMGLRSKAHLN